jgi:hypothetical protein
VKRVGSRVRHSGRGSGFRVSGWGLRVRALVFTFYSWGSRAQNYRIRSLWFKCLRFYSYLLEPSPCLFEQLRSSAPARGGLEFLKKSKGKRTHSEDFGGK